uniref:Uncharacterized protein n=1 Tax=Schizaphis graminum TaxID=13262 RepID=A0A2S2NMC1_SCHGA
MAGSIVDNANLYSKTFKYVPPTPPANLIDSTNYTLHFNTRKFIHIGIDPTDNFNVVIHVITASRYVKVTPDFLRSIFSLMGHILSFILDQIVKYKRIVFLETDIFKLSSMVYGGENVLVLESKIQDGCRVLLNRNDLLQLQYLEWPIFETVVRKSTIMRPVILDQFKMFGGYIDQKLAAVKSIPRSNDEMEIFIKNLQNQHIIATLPKDNVSLISQLKVYALTQLTENRMQRQNGKMLPVASDFVMDMHMSPSYSPKTTISSMQSDSPTREEFIRSDDVMSSDNLESPQSPNEIHSQQPFDINDGPDFFNTPPSTQSTYAKYPAPVRKVKRQLF